MCPYKTVQYRSECKSWLSDETKELMKVRDNTRERARESDDAEAWISYKSLRNRVNKLVNQDRKKHYDNIYTRHYNNKDVGATYKAG